MATMPSLFCVIMQLWNIVPLLEIGTLLFLTRHYLWLFISILSVLLIFSTIFDDSKKKEKSPSSANPSTCLTPSPRQQKSPSDAESKTDEEEEEEEEDENRIVPQLRIGEDGKIIVDQRR